jgi:uncharacterized protein with FMN-binding domain
MNIRFYRMTLCCVVTLASFVASTAFAGGPAPSNLDDIVYQDAGWGSKQLRSRGYTMISSDYHDGKTVEYWWGAGPNTCLKVREYDYKYESIKTTSSTDCNQYHEEATKNDNAAGIAIAAVAILGAAVLASQSHHRDDKYEDDSKSMAEFDRGYKDGLHHASYHNYQNTTAYSDGYNQGQVQREEETRHHSNSGYHSSYQSYVSLDGLVGARASGADTELRARGFSDTGGYKQGDKSFVTWWNASTRQCVQAVTKDGRIKNIQAINEGNCN